MFGEQDITMCSNNDCLKRFLCYRFNAKPNKYWQSYSRFEPIKKKCEYFIHINEYKKTPVKKSPKIVRLRIVNVGNDESMARQVIVDKIDTDPQTNKVYLETLYQGTYFPDPNPGDWKIILQEYRNAKKEFQPTEFQDIKKILKFIGGE